MGWINDRRVKKALLESNIQIIGEHDGKFVLLSTDVFTANVPIVCEVLFSREIPVGSIFITQLDVGIEKIDIVTAIYVCCNASQRVVNKIAVKNNLFWYELTTNEQLILPNK